MIYENFIKCMAAISKNGYVDKLGDYLINTMIHTEQSK